MNFDAVCRTCLTTDDLNPIFGSVDDTRYAAAVFVTAGVKVAIDDGLPQQMCARCISFLNASLKFRKQCKDAETRLLRVKYECDDAADSFNSEGVDSEQPAWAYSMAAERAPVKAEPEWGARGTSAAAAAEGLYVGHEIKDELVVGPELVQPQDIAFSMQSARVAAPLQPRSCFVRLERFPIEGLQRNSHTSGSCLATFDREPSLRSHSCTNSVEESKFYKVSGESAKKLLGCDICGKQFIKKRQIIRHLVAHNVQEDGGKRSPYSSEDVPQRKNENQSGGFAVRAPSPAQPRRFVPEATIGTLAPPASALPAHASDTPGPHSCDICSDQFTSKQTLIGHVTTAHIHRDDSDKTKKHKCDVCSRGFARNSNLTVHARRAHSGEKPFSCDICKKKFTTNCNLTIHRRTHTGEKPFSCGVCNKRFTMKSNLTHHMLIHMGEKLYSCDICKKRFTQKSNLARHVRIHTGERPFSCDTCKKKFTTNCNLTIHRRTHTGEKPFSCGVCNKRFTTKLNLTNHIIIHTGEKLYSCDICKKKFARKFTLTCHMSTHTREKLYSCDTVKRGE